MSLISFKSKYHVLISDYENPAQIQRSATLRPNGEVKAKKYETVMDELLKRKLSQANLHLSFFNPKK